MTVRLRDPIAAGVRGAAKRLLLCSLISSSMLITTVEPSRSEDNGSKAIPEQSIAASLPYNGDPDGRRRALGEKGVTYRLNYVGEWQSNVSGGVGRGSDYMGRLEGVLDIDLGKLVGWRGWAFHVNGYQIHGDPLSRERINNLMPVSYIEALPATRLGELWLEQKFLGDKLKVRFGQMAADNEFHSSSYAAQFINNTFGWPMILAANLPSGGPAYPFATPGIKVQLDPNKSTSLLLGVFNGDPAGPGAGDPEKRDPFSAKFRVQDPPLIMAEAQYRYDQDKGASGLAGTVKFGAWTHFGRFDDQRLGTDSLGLADPASNGNPARVRDDHGIYGVIDQQIWRPKTGEADKGVGVFARASASPSKQNLIDLYFDGGIVFAGFPMRPDDALGFGAAYARISGRARAMDQDAVALGEAIVIRDFEALFEANYQAQILPGLQIDLDLQRVIHPGGHIAGPNGAAIPDATVLTLHTLVKY